MQTVSKIHVYKIKISVSGGQQQEIRMKSTSPEKKGTCSKTKVATPADPNLTSDEWTISATQLTWSNKKSFVPSFANMMS